MKPITGEWVDKAEGDFVTAQRELNALDHPNYDAVCFHSQQCAEKYLKATYKKKIFHCERLTISPSCLTQP